MVWLATTMIGIAGLALVAIGARFLMAPAGGAKGFGLVADAHDPYLLVKGARDIVVGLILIALIAVGHWNVLAVVTMVIALIPIADCVIVRARGGAAAVAFGVHLATAIFLVAAATILLVV